jgi:hypothetical protein
MRCLQQSTDNRPTFATNRPIGRNRPANGVIKKMAELSAMLYKKFAEADQFDLPAEASAQAGATIKRNLEVLGYGK